MPTTTSHIRDLTFGEWMTAVDREVKAAIGFGVADLPDWGFHDAFDDGMTPGEAATEILEENGVDW